jgi:hypothetical protein
MAGAGLCIVGIAGMAGTGTALEQVAGRHGVEGKRPAAEEPIMGMLVNIIQELASQE